jgi:hypothetical protein
MATPVPTDEVAAARRVLREAALPAMQRRLRLSAHAVDQLAAVGVSESLEALGQLDRAHAGWALLLTGVQIARSTDALAPPSARGRDSSFGVGLLWAGLVAGVGGDRLIAGADRHPPSADWEPGEHAPEVRQLAGELAGGLLDPLSTPEARRRYTTDSIAELDAGLSGLEHRPSGWMLSAFGVWMGSGVGGVARPLTRRRGLGLRAVKDPRRAEQACGFAGALVAEVGLGLLGDLPAG